MGRVINTNNPGKIRTSNRRLIAELLQRLGQKQTVDAETKDMAAAIVYALREIYATCMTSVEAWEKRDYWIKAERFIRDWEWTNDLAANFEDIIREEAWHLLPQLMMDLFPYFTDIQVKTLTKKPAEWAGAHQQLLKDPPNTIPY